MIGINTTDQIIMLKKYFESTARVGVIVLSGKKTVIPTGAGGIYLDVNRRTVPVKM